LKQLPKRHFVIWKHDPTNIIDQLSFDRANFQRYFL
jgi:hypothetical protein